MRGIAGPSSASAGMASGSRSIGQTPKRAATQGQGAGQGFKTPFKTPFRRAEEKGRMGPILVSPEPGGLSTSA